ncbi:uncharacterized protein CTRU02_204478 [Colletotrichum truncatum]|uniref:Uncharacterized protein n=1 Tax=Colletotrichum truncatum TaxID=5467 RepID=A0ACC3ZCG6_COLTU
MTLETPCAELRSKVRSKDAEHYKGSTPNVSFKLSTIINNLGKQWQHGENSHNAINPNALTDFVAHWKGWRDDFFLHLLAWAMEFVEYRIKEMLKYWSVAKRDMARQVL